MRSPRVMHAASRHPPESNITDDNLSRYVMLLEGKAELPVETLENICREVDEVIQKGKMWQPENLLRLLHRSSNFRGVMEFDSLDLHCGDLPQCWLLPVITLTSIALVLTKVEKQKSSWLLNNVCGGHWFVKLMDKYLDRGGHLGNMKAATDAVWVGVELHHKWHDKDLHETFVGGTYGKEILQELSDEAERTMGDFKKGFSRGCLMRNPLNWPERLLPSANSMHRIARTMLVCCDKSEDELLDNLYISTNSIV